MNWDRLRKIGEKALAGRLAPEARLGKFRFIRRLGEGGMGEVWLAHDEERGLPIALKILTGVRDSDRDRFERESTLASQLDHPHIVKVYEAGEIEGNAYISMQYIPGESLNDKLDDPQEAARIIAGIADALQAAHDRGIIHRDIKPDNLIRTPEGAVYLSDFGLALGSEDPRTSTSQSGTILGTPAFMAPELARGHPRDASTRSDIYSLGATLYALLSGNAPFTGDNLYDIIARIVDGEPPPLAVDRALQKVVAQAMAKNPARRYSSAKELGDDLRRYLRGERVRARRPWRVSKHGLIVTAAAVLACAAGAAWIVAPRDRSGMELRQSLEAALDCRRKGDAGSMAGLLKVMEASYRPLASAETEYLMGRMRRAMLDDAGALWHQTRALELDPEFLPARYERIVLCVRMKHAAPRDDRLPADSPAHALVAWADSKWDEAASGLTQAVHRDPSLEEAWEALTLIELQKASDARSFEEKETHWKRAEDLATQALEKDRGYAPHYLHRGRARFEFASHSFGRGIDPSERLAAAHDDFSQVLRLDPNSAKARIGKAMTRVRRPDAGEASLSVAENECSEALRLGPDRRDAYFWRGIVRTNRATLRARADRNPTGDYESAIQDFSEVLRRTPNDAESLAKRAIARHGLAAWARVVGAPAQPLLEAALKDADQAVRLRDDLAEAKVTRAMVRTTMAQVGGDRLAELESAERDLNSVLETDSSIAEAWQRRGHVHWNRAQYFESIQAEAQARTEYYGAVKAYEKALELNRHLEPFTVSRLNEARKKCAE